MTRITIISVGKKPPAWVRTGYGEYAKRLSRDIKLELVEIPPARRGKSVPGNSVLEAESVSIMKAIPQGSFKILLDEKGKRQTTTRLSERLREWSREALHVCFIVGGPDGLHGGLFKTADETWSVSDFTLPHAFIRVILAEQLYRAVSILANHPYHRA